MEFWKCLYEELGSVFVSGVPSGAFGTLINTMDSSYMHFVPAVSDEVAIGLCIGAFTAGIKACVLVEKNNLVLLKEKIKVYEDYIKKDNEIKNTKNSHTGTNL